LASNDKDLKISPEYDLESYFRMIAKIAHAFAVSQIGLDGFEPHLLPIIIGNVVRLIPYLIGASKDDIPVRSDALSHQVGLGTLPWGTGHMVRVRIRLFAAHDHTPAYNVIVGPLKMSLEQFELRIARLVG
jgi:hypothetical protein